ncbi:hypothetical protein DL546_002049 [Coniochaeta pulveracea]|uniref:Uncharacterized protein n=1 Tax=Coniochaeta pulveracea TaxID=177199 RepID=A0A420XWJ1_9PEZI|nr:hypothetical protein DL546_002049 [Coniochaeta pulveracea]
MGEYIINKNGNNIKGATEEMAGQMDVDFGQPYSVLRYERTSGPWHNILDAPGTDTWPGQTVYATGEDHSPNGSAIAIQGSNEDLHQNENGDKTVQKKKKKKKDATKDDEKKDDNGPSRKDKKDGDREGKKDRSHGHKSHGHGHKTQRAV